MTTFKLMHYKDIIQVIGANSLAIGVSWSQVNQGLTTVSLLLAISFTIYKFYKHPK